MLSRHLQMLGINMGVSLDSNEESYAIKRINQFIFRQINASWDHVTPFSNLYSSKEHMKSIEQMTRSLIWPRLYLNHIGILKTIKSIWIENIKWGWKDPRNTFTLVFWKSIFPDAKVIHIYRNPIDVSLSLISREKDYGARINYNSKSRAFMMLRHGGLGLSNVNLLNINNCLRLWEQYVTQALVYQSIYHDSYLSICFEDYILDSGSMLNKLIEFLDVNPDNKLLSRIEDKLDPSKCYKYVQSEEGMNLYSTYRDNVLFEKLGYLSRIDRVL